MGGCVQSLLTRAKNKDFHVLDKPAKNRKPIGCLEITFSHTFEITLEHFLSPARVSLLSGRCLTLFRGTKCTHDSAGLRGHERVLRAAADFQYQDMCFVDLQLIGTAPAAAQLCDTIQGLVVY